MNSQIVYIIAFIYHRYILVYFNLKRPLISFEISMYFILVNYSGSSIQATALKRNGINVVGTDISEEMINLIQQYARIMIYIFLQND